ncbi:MAG: 2-dehydro-3-deoxygalactonokinase [Devosiaceae bacterium]
MAAIKPDWIAVDWGTTHMRAYAMNEAGNVLARGRGAGMGALAAGQNGGDFEDALAHVISDWLGDTCGDAKLPIVACGMVGSRQGWAEAGYLPVPHDLADLASALTPVVTRNHRLSVWVVPGLRQSNPFDVMRGEETQLAGYVSQVLQGRDAPSGRVCLPGTHAKWARLDGNSVVHFSTAMTGEVFDLLTEHSILSHSVDGEAMDAQAFGDAVEAAFHDPAMLTQSLFSVRAEGLLAGEDGARARARVSGLLIGAELAGARLNPGEVISLIGTASLCQAYSDALTRVGHGSTRFEGEAMVLAGLMSVHAQLQQSDRIPA